jgi:hypothetical protein
MILFGSKIMIASCNERAFVLQQKPLQFYAMRLGAYMSIMQGGLVHKSIMSLLWQHNHNSFMAMRLCA